jgi:ornithine cyclodeaminase/alanine dehydrogenase-like protein (mu-crystallin family)
MKRVLILGGAEIAELARIGDYIAAVEDGFRAHAEGRTISPLPLHIPAGEGGFHVKSAALGTMLAVKINGNYPQNPLRHGLPSIQGVIALFDMSNGSLLALMDSIEITAQRTAAASAVAARLLARSDAMVATICGCGRQGRVQLAALREVLPLRRAYAWDIDATAAELFADEMTRHPGIEARAVIHLREATLASDVIVTCTSAKQPFLDATDVRPGTFIAAIGADNPAKSEIAPALMARAKIVVDLLPQCLEMGDLHHAVAAGLVSAADVHAELGDIVIGRQPGRTTLEEITLFDSTGTALQDVAAAIRIHERALERGAGTILPLGGPIPEELSHEHRRSP